MSDRQQISTDTAEEFEAAVAALAARVDGPVRTAGDAGYDEERTGYQTYGNHRPAVVVGATGPQDVRAAVEFGAAHGLPVGVQGTGHAPTLPAEGGVLISTRRMAEVKVDPVARTAWVAAGAVWRQVVEQTAPHGLAPLNGSAPGVGVVSYTLGGGLGLLARRYGYAADHVRSIDVVTADGQLRHVTADSDPDLFWALRGGRENFGIVTGLEFGLVPVAELYGGGLFLDGELAVEALRVYRRWTETVPEEMTSSIAFVPFPDVPVLPAPLRGRYLVHIRIAYLGDAGRGSELVAPLREIGPVVLDGLRVMPYAESGSIHAEPPHPAPYVGTNVLLRGLDDELCREVLELTGPAAEVTSIVEIRHLGGALAAPPAVANSVGHRGAAYLLGVLNKVGPQDPVEVLRAAQARLVAAAEPQAQGKMLNFLNGGDATPERVRLSYEVKDYGRLQKLKAAYDPANLFRLGHNIPPVGARS
ncbi:FAD-binding oxidoreductase [Kitasatospora sp. NPDC002227]|uniref:FAD-binding oxidoreductase n=1 Tax=Kitasatospora sp. NPDC002227 TaxID=3154773 RepID=UPI0033173F03